jgi:hypothetical protein
MAIPQKPVIRMLGKIIKLETINKHANWEGLVQYGNGFFLIDDDNLT